MDSLSCTYARIVYPQFTDTSRQRLNDVIIDAVQKLASNFMVEDNMNDDLQDMANAFVLDYSQFVHEFTDYKLGWYLIIESDVIYNSTSYVSMRIDIETFTGGAHPNTTTNYYVFNTHDNQPLTLSDIVSDTTLFKEQLEKAFRIQKGIDDTVSLADAGYNLYDDEMVLNENIGISENDVIVHFNPYEIAPYSMGPSTVRLDKNSIRDILKIEWSEPI
jgi:hypothetical protein